MWYIIKPILYIVLFIIIVLFSIFVYVLANIFSLIFVFKRVKFSALFNNYDGSAYVYIKHSNPFEYANYTLNFLK